MAASPKRASFYADLDRLRTVFQTVDVGGKGYIVERELARLTRSVPGLEESMTAELMEKLDRDRDGKVSFADFEALFELGRDTGRKLPQTPTREDSIRGSLFKSPPSHITDSISPESQSLEFSTALESLPSEVASSPSSEDPGEEGPPVVRLRHKRIQHRKTSAPVGLPRQTQSMDMPDLAAQVRSLTTPEPFESPGQLHRRSKVLSWISETEDWPEDLGALSGDEGRAPSPLLSPRRGNDEASHAKAVLESVCNTNEIGRDAIMKLCNHVKADPQEEQELLLLLEQLDREQHGSVSLDNFVRGLQAVRNAAVVTSTPSPRSQLSLRRRRHSQPLPKLSESFSTPISSKPAGTQLASIPLATPGKEVSGFDPVLAVLDPNNSGYVSIDSIVSQFQMMGLDSPHNESIEEALQEAVPVDPAGRMSVSDLIASLESALIGERTSHSVLRKAGLQSYKMEISMLRTQMHQAHMEKDKIKSKLNSTLEENRRLAREGDEHAETVARAHQQKVRELDTRYTERLKETERIHREEVQQLREKAVARISNLEEQMNKLKTEDEKLRADLKYAEEEVHDVTDRLSKVHTELNQKDRMIAVLQRELTQLHSNQGSGKDIENQLQSRLNELQSELSERAAQMQELQESNRELQDRVDELAAEREEWKQKYKAQKRKVQRKKSFGSRQQGTPRKHRRHSSKEEKSLKMLTTEAKKKSSPMAPLLSFDETDGAPSFIAEGAIGVESGAESPTSPHTPMDSSEETPTSASDDLFTRSSASLLDEFSQEETRVLSLEKVGNEQLRREKSELEQTCQDLKSQLQALEENEAQRREELEKELEKTKQKQAKVDELLENLEKQRRKLSLTRMEIEAQLANAEDSIAKQLENILKTKKLITATSEPDIKPDLSKLQAELEQSRSQLDTAKEKLVDQQRLSEVTMARLADQITALESDKAAQAQARDEERLKLSGDIKSLNERHKSERESHERDINSIKERLEKAESLLRKKETAHCEEMAAAQQRLQISESKATEYKSKASSLEIELQETKSALSAAEAQKDIAVVHPALTVQATPPPSLHTEEEFASLKSTLEQVKQDHAGSLDAHKELELQVEALNERLASTQSRYSEEVDRLQSKVHSVQSELSEQSRVHSTEIAQLKESTQNAMQKKEESCEMQIAKAREECEKQIQSNRQLSELQLELVKQELKACEHRERLLQEKLRTTESQHEAAVTEASQLRERESSYQQQIAEYETSEEKYKCDIEQFRRDLKRRTEELEAAQEIEKKHRVEIGNLTEELSRSQARQSEEAVDAADFSLPLESFPRSPLPVSPSRLSYRSDQSLHDELISQMKAQLEDLQGVLISQGTGGTDGGEEELSLVQELLLTIQNGMNRDKQSMEEENGVARALEFPIPKVTAASPRRPKSRSNEQTPASVVSAMVTELSTLVDTLQSQCEGPLSDYEQRIKKLTSLTSTLAKSLHEQDQQHKKKVSILAEELENARTASDSYRSDVDRLKSDLAISQEDMNRSRGEMERLQKTKDSEMESLKARLRRAESLKREREEKALQAGGLSATAITHSDFEAREREVALRDKLLTGKDTEISDLRAELSQIKSLMVTIKKAQSRAEREAEDQLNQKEKELDYKNQKILELETKLKTHSESSSLMPESEGTVVFGEKTDTSREVAVMAVESAQAPREGEAKPQEQHSLPEDSATEHEQQLQTLRQKYNDELSTAKLALEQQTRDLREIYSLLTGPASEEHPLNHSLLVQEIRKEVKRLQSQNLESQQLAQELEEALQQHQEEHDQMDSQFQAEHEEEVKALRQQKQQLFRQNEELKLHYQQLLSDQDKQNATLLQDLFNSRSQIEVQMRDARLEKLKAEKQVADLTEEKQVLMGIIKQLAVEAGTMIDIT